VQAGFARLAERDDPPGPAAAQPVQGEQPQLSVLGSLPPVALAALMQFQVISPTFGLAAAPAGGLLAIDCAAGLVVARLFDRERLITGSRPSGGITQLPQPVGE
jgi:hypothetical protein